MPFTQKDINELKSTLDRLDGTIEKNLSQVKTIEKSLNGKKLESADLLSKAKGSLSKVEKLVGGLSPGSDMAEYKKAYKAVEDLESDVEDAVHRLDREITQAEKEDKETKAGGADKISEMIATLNRLEKMIAGKEKEMASMQKLVADYPDLLEDLDPAPIVKVKSARTKVETMVFSLKPTDSPADFKKVSTAVDGLEDDVEDMSHRLDREFTDANKGLKQRRR
jgi:phage shock protein A